MGEHIIMNIHTIYIGSLAIIMIASAVNIINILGECRTELIEMIEMRKSNV